MILAWLRGKKKKKSSAKVLKASWVLIERLFQTFRSANVSGLAAHWPSAGCLLSWGFPPATHQGQPQPRQNTNTEAREGASFFSDSLSFSPPPPKSPKSHVKKLNLEALGAKRIPRGMLLPLKRILPSPLWNLRSNVP